MAELKYDRLRVIWYYTRRYLGWDDVIFSRFGCGFLGEVM